MANTIVIMIKINTIINRAFEQNNNNYYYSRKK